MPGRKILLIEPGYKNKYPPLGLMKIAQYHGPRNKNDEVRFIKGCNESVKQIAWDRIDITTLFSFEFQKIAETIDFALDVVHGQADRIFVGGIAASLMHDQFAADERWQGIRFIKGLLSEPPAVSLRLDEFAEELYADDRTGTPIEDLVPDYSILDQVDYRYPVRDAYFAYASRGCIRKCNFCGVPKLEGAQREMQPISEVVTGIERLYGTKRDLILMDNNVVASSRFKEIISEIRDLGFARGAKLKRINERVPSKRRVDFNQGVDARILAKDRMFLRELSTICLSPLRIAFDHLGLKGPYETAIRYAHEFGLDALSNYMLYNFHNSPRDLFERMRMNVALNEELKIRIWSFPMRYQPTDLADRSYVGENWNRYFLRSVQIVLQATHGVVSGEPDFFKRAFGDTHQEFESILIRPHHYIFNRDWYERLEGRGEFDEFSATLVRLSQSQRVELAHKLSSANPSDYRLLRDAEGNSAIKNIMRFYLPMPKTEEHQIWLRQKTAATKSGCTLSEEEIVEDAGLDDEYGAISSSPGERGSLQPTRSNRKAQSA